MKRNKSRNAGITKVTIQFNDVKKDKIDTSSEVKSKEVKRKKNKFVTKVTLDEVGTAKLKRVFFLMHRCRMLSKRFIEENKEITLNELKALVKKYLTKETLSHVMNSIIKREVYYMHKEKDNIQEVNMNPNSINFYEESSVNNRFVLNYRRDKIYIEDLDIMLILGRQFPEFKEDRKFYLNICVDDPNKIGYIYTNVFFKK